MESLNLECLEEFIGVWFGIRYDIEMLLDIILK